MRIFIRSFITPPLCRQSYSTIRYLALHAALQIASRSYPLLAAAAGLEATTEASLPRLELFNFDLDLFRLGLFAFGQHHSQNPVLELRVDLVHVNETRQHEAAGEFAVVALDAMIILL